MVSDAEIFRIVMEATADSTSDVPMAIGHNITPTLGGLGLFDPRALWITCVAAGHICEHWDEIKTLFPAKE